MVRLAPLLPACLLLALFVHALVAAVRTGSYTGYFSSVLAKPYLVTRAKQPRTFWLLIAMNALTILAIVALLFDTLAYEWGTFQS